MQGILQRGGEIKMLPSRESTGGKGSAPKSIKGFVDELCKVIQPSKLAEKLMIERSAVSHWRSGRNPMRDEYIEYICKNHLKHYCPNEIKALRESERFKKHLRKLKINPALVAKHLAE